MEKVDREMDEAIKKHGELVVPKFHVEEFYERIER
jgi:hypothetical protein